jgi:hypothetical protein
MRKNTRDAIQAMVGQAIESAQSRGVPFRNPFIGKRRRLYPLKYVRKFSTKRVQMEGSHEGD